MKPHVIVPPLKLVQVTWIDSRGNSTNQWTGWNEAMEMDLGTIESVGWLLKQDDMSVTIAPHIEQGHMVGGEYIIPKICVRQITELAPKRVRK